MITTDLLAPTSIVYENVNGRTLGGGAATSLAALQDGSDATYVQCGTAAPWEIQLAFGTPALTANARIEAIWVIIRTSQTSVSPTEQVVVKGFGWSDPLTSAILPVLGGIAEPAYLSDGVVRANSTTQFNFFNNWRSINQVTPLGTRLIVTLEQKARDPVTGVTWTLPWPGLCKVMSVTVAIACNRAPSSTSTVPQVGTGGNNAGEINNTSKPYVAMVYTDADTDSWQKARVKWINKPMYDAGGFNAETAVADVDSGEFTPPNAVLLSSFSYAASALTNQQRYKAFVKVWQPPLNNEQFPSPQWYASSEFLMNVLLPVTPTMTVAKDDPENKYTIVLQGRNNELTLNQSSIETDTGGWAAGLQTTIARTTAQAADGAASMSLTKTVAIGIGSATTLTGTAGIPVLPHTTYTMLCSYRAAVTPRTCQNFLTWYDSVGAMISTAVSAGVVDTTSGWTQVVLTVASPNNAAFAALVPGVNAMAVSEVAYIDKISFAPGDSTVWSKGGYVTADQRLNLQRSIDGGATWLDVLQADQLLTTGQQLTIVDHEVPPYTEVTYRARSLIIDAVDGDWSATSAPLACYPASWWLKCPNKPVLNMAIRPDNPRLQLARPMGVDYALNDNAAVVTHQGTRGFRISLTVRTLSQKEYRQLISLIADGKTLLLQSVIGEQWYVQPLSGPTFAPYRAQATYDETFPIRHAHEIDLDFVEVSRPGKYRQLYG